MVPHPPSNRLRGSNSSTIKQHNRAIVLRALLERGALSRQMIARLTGLTPSTITNVVAQLAAAGLVEEVGKDESVYHAAGGRQPILVDVRAEGALALAVQVEYASVHVGVVNAKGVVEDVRMDAIPTGSGPEEVIQLIIGMVDDVLRMAARERVVGLGIATIGLVNPSTGTIEYVALHDWHNVPLAATLASRFGLPVAIENSARAMALAEHWYGIGRPLHDLIFIDVSVGIGSGIIIDGRVHRGVTGLAGEIGHTLAVEHGLRCVCGNCGCLETVASTVAIVDRFRADTRGALDGNCPQASRRVVDAAEIKRIATHVLVAAAGGDRHAADIVRGVARPLASAIANLVDVVDPQCVIIGGDVLTARDLVLQTIKQTVIAQSLVPTTPPVEIVSATLGPRIGVIGAATLAFEHYLNASDIVLEINEGEGTLRRAKGAMRAEASAHPGARTPRYGIRRGNARSYSWKGATAWRLHR